MIALTLRTDRAARPGASQRRVVALNAPVRTASSRTARPGLNGFSVVTSATFSNDVVCQIHCCWSLDVVKNV